MTPAVTKFIHSKNMIEIESQTWQTVDKAIEKELETTQKRVLTRGLSLEETEYLRGFYAALKKIKELPTPSKPIPVIPGNY